MQDFKKLMVWQRAHELALLVYRLTVDFPRDEVFGLRNSLRKTSVDIPAYIAEGCGKLTPEDSARSIAGAIALANRLEYFELLAWDLHMLNESSYLRLSETTIEVRKMLSGFAKRVMS